MAGVGGPLPFRTKIQASFGKHEIGNVQAHTGPAAAEAAGDLGARAYAIGNQVAFAGAPDLHTAAHEATHVVQQRAGVQLKDGIGRSGDVYERHADAVADLVVAGASAEALLDTMAGPSGSPSSLVVQRDEFDPLVPAFDPTVPAGDICEDPLPSPPDKHHETLATFVQTPPVKLSPDGRTMAVLQHVFKYFHIDDKVIGGWLDGPDQYWKINWHIDAMVTRIEESKYLTADQWKGTGRPPPDPTSFHNALDGVLAALNGVKSPVAGFFVINTIGYPIDEPITPEQFSKRYSVMNHQKDVLAQIFGAMKPWEYFDDSGWSGTRQMIGMDCEGTMIGLWSLTFANVLPPGPDNKHGTGSSLDIRPGKNAADKPQTVRVWASAKAAGCLEPYDETNHVHCDWPQIKAPK